MKYAIDTSVLIDHLRGYPDAVELLDHLLDEDARVLSPYVVGLEVLAGMRPGEEPATYELLDLIEWFPLAETECDAAGALGRQYLPANEGIDTPDLLLAELAKRQGAEVLTNNIKHFREMFPGIVAPYVYR